MEGQGIIHLCEVVGVLYSRCHVILLCVKMEVIFIPGLRTGIGG